MVCGTIAGSRAKVILYWIFLYRVRTYRDDSQDMDSHGIESFEEAQTPMPDSLDVGPFRPDRPGIRKVLGDLEAEIMELIWSRPDKQGTTVRDVFEVLYERRRLAYTTIMSTMTRLARKGLLRAEKADQAYVYYPIFTQDEFVSRFVGRILDDLLVNFSGVTLERLRAISESDNQASLRVERLLEEIARRRSDEDHVVVESDRAGKGEE
jgi:predicted transcriptional regulator